MSRRSALLLGMPFFGIEMPNLAVALLKSHLTRAGFTCDSCYPNLELMSRLHPDVQRYAPRGPMTGEWLFVPAVYGGPIVDDEYERYAEYARGSFGDEITDEILARFVDARPACTDYINELADRIDWDRYDVVGFSLVFQQTMASLALAERIKARRPDLPIVFGGPSVHGEMGLALHERFPQIDVVCSGEGDEVIVPLFEAMVAGRDVSGIGGIVHRVGDTSVASSPATPVVDLDALPVPDFDDWFRDRAAAGLADEVNAVTIEASRGCWWGAISHCTFCGLNGQTMSYRSKSPDRVLAEIVELRDRYGARFVAVADNIFDMRYLRTLIPAMAELDPPVQCYLEIRPKMKRHQVGALAAAGVTAVQPGIESLSDHSLHLMGKETTGLEGIQLLKHCAEYGIGVAWNYLYGVPGETAEGHRAAIPLVTASRHLPPPRNVGPVQIARFSPLHERAAELGFVDVHAESVIELLFPFEQSVLDRIAYGFEGSFAPGLEEAVDVEPLVAELAAWVDGAGSGCLWESDEDDGSLRLTDDRPWSAQPGTLRLVDWRADVYRRCDSVCTRADLARVAADLGVDHGRLHDFLAWCEARHLIAVDGERVVGVAVHHPARPLTQRPRLAVLAVSAG